MQGEDHTWKITLRYNCTVTASRDGTPEEYVQTCISGFCTVVVCAPKVTDCRST